MNIIFARLTCFGSNCVYLSIFYSLVVVGRGSEIQIQVGQKIQFYNLTLKRLEALKYI